MSAGLLIVIAPDVPVVQLAEALAAAGHAIRQDSRHLVIRPSRPLRTIASELCRLLNWLSLALLSWRQRLAAGSVEQRIHPSPTAARLLSPSAAQSELTERKL